ncbi:hypothetical protein N7486_004471 [Penicillium sp. IBT 16267x]|nr:hypothetical protein N7486_004471 [Penicillium sp. IBT 16267x]
MKLAQALTNYQIARFFKKNGPTTQENCHDTAAQIVGGSVAPTSVQGMTSYTVTAGNANRKALQFRAPDAALDMKIMARVRDIYKHFVPSCQERGSLGGLFVYEMDIFEGVAFSLAQRDMCGINNYMLLERAVYDLAKFLASSWTEATEMAPWTGTAVTRTELFQQLKTLANALPERFRPQLNEVRDQLPLIFAPDYPQVLNHTDLLEMNIYVNPSTGAITGIVDWHDATVGPFGLSFWGLETLLGTLGLDGWHFYARHLDLRRTFWNTLYSNMDITECQKQAVKVGRIVGIFQAYGLKKGAPVEIGDVS